MRARSLLVVVLGSTLWGASPAAAADPPAVDATQAAEEERFSRELEHAPPPPSHVVYLQYGVAFTANQILAPGRICDDLSKPCILGAGGGVISPHGHCSQW